MPEDNNKEYIHFNNRIKKYAFLSNDFSCRFMIDNKEYWHLEGYFQSQLFAKVNEKAENSIRNAFSPITCRKLVSNYGLCPDRREEWVNGLRDEVMMKGLITKFVTDSKLSRLLVDTKDSILVNISEDSYWGVGKDKQGENKLGILLMAIRKFLSVMYQKE